MKRKYVILLFVLAAFAFAFIKIIYPIINISSVYPPMKEYNFSLTPTELVNEMDNLDKGDSSLNFKITDTTGSSKSYLKYYADIYLKIGTSSYTFNIFYNQSGKEHSKIGLVGAFDNTHKFGGYQNDNKDMQSLINIFENKFIDKMN